ncbi:MAG: hypothetical protein O7G88_01360 [bacterium]|nr:hypothetical protein [bacterium]
MAGGKMPRRFWSYTAGKGDIDAEEREAAWEKRIQLAKEYIPALAMLGVILLLTLLMLMMMFAEFRGFYLDQLSELFRVR